jgi:hypothetical protein
MPRSKSYSNYTYQDVKKLGLTVTETRLFSDDIPVFEPTAFLLETLEINKEIPSNTEKAKSELFVTPILSDLRRRMADRFTFFSGYQFNVDKSLGLQGFCDYIITQTPRTPYIENPILAIVEAKNEGVENDIPQCIAEMYAAQLFNQKNGITNIPVMFGTVTSAYEWIFISLEGNKVLVDTERYYMKDLPKLLGILKHIIA